jgi:hypothetical protein
MPRTTNTLDHADGRRGKEHTSKSCTEGGELQTLHKGRRRMAEMARRGYDSVKGIK